MSPLEENIHLENQAMRLEFNPKNGALTGLTVLRTGWKVLDRPHLGLSFRLLVPLSEERRNNPVYGENRRYHRRRLGRMANRFALPGMKSILSTAGACPSRSL